jgi:hypothetical protein
MSISDWFGLDPVTGSEYENPTSLTTSFQTFYIPVVDAGRTGATDISTGIRWVFHNNTYAGPIGIEIQKVFVSSSKSETDAVSVVDFTLGDTDNLYKGEAWDFQPGAGTIAGGKWSTGERNDSDYVYLGQFGSGARDAHNSAYWGFVVRNVSATATADSIMLEITDGTNRIANLSIATWFGLDPIEYQTPTALTTSFQTFYIPVVDAARTWAPDISTLQRWHFHNNGNSETVGFAIQKVFVADSTSGTGAIVKYDFSGATDFASAKMNGAYGSDSETGTVTGGAWTSGERVNAGYEYLGDLGSWGEGKAYWGFVIKIVSTNATATAEYVKLEANDGTNPGTIGQIMSFADWFGLD